MEMELFNESIPQQSSSQSSLTPVSSLPLETSAPEAVPNPAAAITDAAIVPFTPINTAITENISGTENTAGGQNETVVAAETARQTKPNLLAPQVLQKIDPVYPDRARREGWEGNVRIRFQVLTNGKTDNISVETSSGFALLDEAAVDAIRQWQFIPAKNRHTNQAVSCWTYVTLVFQLNNAYAK